MSNLRNDGVHANEPATDSAPAGHRSLESGLGMNSRPLRPLSALPAMATFVWLGGIVGALALMAAHSYTPGRAGVIPAHWPAASRIPLDPERPTLVLFAHPRCPCTRATLGELELLTARCRQLVSAHVVFTRPPGTTADWSQTDLWRAASAIPGVTVHRDDDAAETRRFQSETSGQTILYAPDGRLLFQGGITQCRGHAGDNPGRSALVALLEHKTFSPVETPVFGCALLESASSEGGAECRP